MNSVDIFPEFPLGIERAKFKAPKQNVWRKWLEDTPDDIDLIYMNDLLSGKYEPDLFMKEEDQLEGLHKIIKTDFKKFETFFRELQYRSSHFPLIDFDTFASPILNSERKDMISSAQL